MLLFIGLMHFIWNRTERFTISRNKVWNSNYIFSNIWQSKCLWVRHWTSRCPSTWYNTYTVIAALEKTMYVVDKLLQISQNISNRCTEIIILLYFILPQNCTSLTNQLVSNKLHGIHMVLAYPSIFLNLWILSVIAWLFRLDGDS